MKLLTTSGPRGGTARPRISDGRGGGGWTQQPNPGCLQSVTGLVCSSPESSNSLDEKPDAGVGGGLLPVPHFLLPPGRKQALWGLSPAAGWL